MHGIRQSEIRGGNAVNLAHALGRLGLRTLLVTHTEAAHEGLLRKSFEGLDVELRLKPLKAGMTVAFEERVNVMLGDGGGAADQHADEARARPEAPELQPPDRLRAPSARSTP